MQNTKVLVVDDVNSVRKMLIPVLTKELGLRSENIREAYDGQAALKILQNEKIDLILCEWDLPRINGIELLKMIRADNRLAATPVIMITSRSDQSNILEAIQAKVTQYIVKPFTADNLSTTLKKTIQAAERLANKQPSNQSEHSLTIHYKGKPVTSGKISNLGKGGLLAKLLLYRGITVYDNIDMEICFESASGEKSAISLTAELARIEMIRTNAEKTSALYGFIFPALTQPQEVFITNLMEELKKEAPEQKQ